MNSGWRCRVNKPEPTETLNCFSVQHWWINGDLGAKVTSSLLFFFFVKPTVQNLNKYSVYDHLRSANPHNWETETRECLQKNWWSIICNCEKLINWFLVSALDGTKVLKHICFSIRKTEALKQKVTWQRDYWSSTLSLWPHRTTFVEWKQSIKGKMSKVKVSGLIIKLASGIEFMMQLNSCWHREGTDL